MIRKGSARTRRAGPALRLHPLDQLRVAAKGLGTRKMRAGMSALGIAIGVAAIMAVMGISASSQSGLLAQLDRLGTNMLTVSSGSSFTGAKASLPKTAPAMISRIAPVIGVQYTGATSAKAYRNDHIPSVNSNGISVQAASLDLPKMLGVSLAQGRFLNAATAKGPTAVLGAAAAERLGIDHVYPGLRIWVGNTWFYVVGILEPSTLAPEIDTAVLVGFPAAETYLKSDGSPSTIYVRSTVDQVAAVQQVLAATANPAAPNEVDVSVPSASLQARAAAQNAFSGLFLGLGAVSLLVGAIGVANTMLISVLERRQEIGLRRSLGATRSHIRIQFLTEAIILSIIGGLTGVGLGAVATVVFASVKGWSVVIPTTAWAGGLSAALVIGAVAGLLPAMRAARLSPTEALWSI